MMGRRLPDTQWHDIPAGVKPGDYWKYLGKDGEPQKPIPSDGFPSNLTRTVWGYYSPDGNGMGTLMAHTVREHEDGTISVLPGDGSSNSILHKGARDEQWHGYIYNGEWRA